MSCQCVSRYGRRIFVCPECPRLVILESPYNGGSPEATAENVAYARRCLLDCLTRGEAPFASHLLYTQVWDDNVANLRAAGIAAGLAWGDRADASVVYTDRGITPGMKLGIERAQAQGRPVEYRTLG